jgi:hypothetical protein
MNRVLAAFDAVIARLAAAETTARGRFGVALLVGTCATLASVFWYFNPTDILYHTPARLDDFARQCANPLTRDLVEPIIAYRIVAPTIAWLLGLRGVSGLVVQYLALIGTLAVIHVVVRQQRGTATGVLAAAAVASTFAAIWTLAYPGFPDAVTHLLVALALLPLGPAGLTLCLTLATLNDERALMAFPLVALWHWTLGPRDLRKFLTVGGALVAAGAAYLLLRHALTVGWIGPGITRPAVYAKMQSFGERFSPYNSTWPTFLWNVFCGFRWLWVLPLLAALFAPKHLPRYVAWLLLVYALAAAVPTLMVEDVSRSIGFLFPALLLSLLFLGELTPRVRRTLVVTLIALQLLTPVVYRVGTGGRNVRPYLVDYIHLVTGHHPADFIRRPAP